MEEVDEDWMMIPDGGWVCFFWYPVPAHPGNPGQTAVKRLLLLYTLCS